MRLKEKKGEGEKGRRGKISLAKILYCLPVLFLVFSISGQEISVKSSFQKGDFKLVYGQTAADVLISPDDFKVVGIAAHDFAADIERVTGVKPKVKNTTEKATTNVVIIGTLGKNSLIDNLAKSGKIDVLPIQNKWESFLITTVRNPLPNVENALVIVGSNRRGTAFATYEMSQKIGVSPWVWWADATPEHRENLIVSNGKYVSGEPSVKYRGIFLNDEDWGLQPWAAKNFEPETSNIGPKTYAKIFELLLRLKANTCWAAMHEVTKPFNEVPGNAQIADDYAIVMGSSHAEPMLRNNVGEWKDDKEKYNFVSNRSGVTNYWEERVKTNGKFENVYTLGMRGIHDSPIQGTKNQAERIPVLENIISTQRSLLEKYVNPDIEKIPQIFCPYKEVLADYRAGLRVPEDVTIVFPDDNFGYIRYFPNPEEQKRQGGFGVYYHISYLGRPLSYLWLNSTPPALIREEMIKAYDNGMRDFWILNVGDIKPQELGMEYFLKLAYDQNNWRSNSDKFLAVWAEREFGKPNVRYIVPLMNKYYQLGFQRKPEHLQWYLPTEKPKQSDFSAVDYGDEMQKRLDDYAEIRSKAEELYAKMPPSKKDSFYEFILYPVRSAALANERFFAAEKAEIYNKQGRASAKDWAKRAADAESEIKKEAAYFNEKLAGGKWRFIMSPEMNAGQWPSMRSTPPKVSDAVWQRQTPETAIFGVAIEGSEKPVEEVGRLPKFDVFTKPVRFIDVFNQGKSNQNWTAAAKQDWIKLSQTGGDLNRDSRIQVSIDWKKVPVGAEVNGEIEIKSSAETRKIIVPVFNPDTPKLTAGFVEANGVISIEAEHFTKEPHNIDGFSWQVILGLGRAGDAVTIFPQTAKTFENFAVTAPTLEYQFYAFSAGEFDATCFLVPTQPLQNGQGLRYAIGVDNQPPQIVTVGADAEVSSPKWSQNVLNASTTGTTKISFNSGPHVLKIYAVDTGVVLDKIVINTGGWQPSYLGPPETGIFESKN